MPNAIVSDAAIDLIVSEEITDRSFYARHYTHFEWPKGSSGPTVGIGYDCGYVKQAELRADWAGIVSPDTIEALVRAIGKTGKAADAWVKAHGHSVTITFDQAMEQFTTRELPKWIARLQAALPNTAYLSPDCRGALVSLVYNRGCSFALDGARYAEMRAIKEHMIARDFAAIPDEIRSMARLWTGGVARRREHEAQLFEAGLAAMAASPDGLHPDPIEESAVIVAENTGRDRIKTEIPAPSTASMSTAAVVQFSGAPVAAERPLGSSKSFRALLSSIVLVIAQYVDRFTGWMGSLFEALPDLQTDVETQLSTIKSLAGLLGHAGSTVLTPATMTSLSIALLLYAIYRLSLPRGA